MKSPSSRLTAAAIAGLSMNVPDADAAPPAADAPAAAEIPAAEPVKLATVNGAAITSEDIERTLRTRYGPQLDGMPPEQRAQAIQQVTPQMTEELIARALLLGAAMDIEVSEKDVDEVITDIKGNLPQGMKFEDYLSAIGREEAVLRAELVEETKINKHLTARLEKVGEPTEAAIAEYYEANKAEYAVPANVQASHILLKTDPEAGEEGKKAKRAEIDKLRSGLIEAGGEGFDTVAKEHSDCPSGQRGGDLGSFGKGQMVPEFEAAAFSQKTGEIGEVIETQFGYHIIKVTNKTEAGQQPLEKVKDQISQQLGGEQRQAAVQAYLKELEAAGKVTRTGDSAAAEKGAGSEKAPAAKE